MVHGVSAQLLCSYSFGESKLLLNIIFRAQHILYHSPYDFEMRIYQSKIDDDFFCIRVRLFRFDACVHTNHHSTNILKTVQSNKEKEEEKNRIESLLCE